MAVPAPADEVEKAVSTAVDPVFYRTVYRDLSDDLSPLRHYLQAGWREGRDPAPWFSAEAYLAANEDVRAEGLEPLSHYLLRGRREGREIAPSRHAEAYLRLAQWRPPAWSLEVVAGLTEGPRLDPVGAADLERDRILVGAELDRRFYLTVNTDVAAAGSDPVEHFVRSGWREGRDPNPHFSIRDYLESYPDVAASGQNPFVHFLTVGRAEGRLGRHDLGFRYEIIARAEPPAERLRAAVEASARQAPDPAERLADGLKRARPALSDLHVTFSHDNFAASAGGMQFCLQRESALFREQGVDHLHLHPALAWRMVREPTEPGPLGVVLNGESLGVFSPRAVADVLRRAAGPPGRRSFAIHSLLGHEPDETAEILAALGLTQGYFWLHDFASLCAGFHLVRNDVQDCAAPPPDSAACGICAYGPFRARHLAAHRRLFERLSLTVVAPSPATLDFWRASWSYPAAAAIVLPHAVLRPRGPAPVPAAARPFRLAFVGMPVALKGWPIFSELAARHADDHRYQFLHLGGREDVTAPVDFRHVVVGHDRPHAMAEALEAAEADAALIWPLCRETFSFTAYEAAAAGAAVITSPDSGNVAAFVRETGLGRVLSDEAALAEAFQTGAILELARARRRPQRFELVHSGMTADLAGAEGRA